MFAKVLSKKDFGKKFIDTIYLEGADSNGASKTPLQFFHEPEMVPPGTYRVHFGTLDLIPKSYVEQEISSAFNQRDSNRTMTPNKLPNMADGVKRAFKDV